jgi:hypothetical protein
MDHDAALVACLRNAGGTTVGDINALCPMAATLQPAVTATNDAFRATALDPDQAAMFMLIFQSYVNPGLTPTLAADLTENIIMPSHMRWTAAFNCGGGNPDNRVAQFWRQVHQLGHSFRAMPVGPGQVMEFTNFNTPCQKALQSPGSIDDCPRMTGTEFSKGLP